jgi:23S rRNA pseudouridine955/2504/2580 synthase
MIEKKVSEDAAGQRLDKYVRKLLPNVPKSHVYKMFRTRKVRLNSRRGQVDDLLEEGDEVTIRGTADALLGARVQPQGDERPRRLPPRAPVSLCILFEDEHVLALDKPAGMAAHPGSGIESGTVVDEVRAYLGKKAVRNEFAASPAHRLDRDTSGVILVAKSRRAMVRFTEMFTAGQADKEYLALAKGHFPRPVGVIDLPLPEHQQTAKSRQERGVHMQEAVTRYLVLAKGQWVSLLACTIETGRTHQIRRHLAAIGHPVAGDRRHGDFSFNRELRAKYGMKRMFLHARRIRFDHPIDGRSVTVEAPLCPELAAALKKMGIANP